jgi:hypothetical protein
LNHGVVIAQGLALSDAELLSDQVNAGYLFGDRVLDLESGVDLQEGNGSILGD